MNQENIPNLKPLSLADTCRQFEAYETDRWAIEAVCEVETLPIRIVDPCAGTGIISKVLHERGYNIAAIDVVDWECLLPSTAIHWPRSLVCDFLTEFDTDLRGQAVVMNPPFSLACEFVDRARALGAQKVICFQRQAWRESEARREWWLANKPARVWVCGARANCMRFDLLSCHHPEGKMLCPSYLRTKLKKADRPSYDGKNCQFCMGNSSTSMAWYVWEQGQTGAEITSAIYPIITKGELK